MVTTNSKVVKNMSKTFRMLIFMMMSSTLLSGCDSVSSPQDKLLDPAIMDQLTKATTFYKHKDYATFLKMVKPLAEQGHPLAQYFLGDLYENGRGVAQDYAQAAFWYKKSAVQNFSHAQAALGKLYYYGRGVEQNYAKAHAWWSEAAKRGSSEAKTYLEYFRSQ